jgi:hypothetical protein
MATGIPVVPFANLEYVLYRNGNCAKGCKQAQGLKVQPSSVSETSNSTGDGDSNT